LWSSIKSFISDVFNYILIALIAIIGIPTIILVMILCLAMCIVLAPFALLVEVFEE